MGKRTTQVKGKKWGCPGDSMVKDFPDSAGDTGLIPDPGKSHRPCSNQSRVPQLLSLFLEPRSHD